MRALAPQDKPLPTPPPTLNPFAVLKDVEVGRLEPGEAAKRLDITPRMVMKRLAHWSGHLTFLQGAYPLLMDTTPPNRTSRSEVIDQIAARISKSRRQVLRMLTEYRSLPTPETYLDRQLAAERKRFHLANLEDLAAQVLCGTTVQDLLNTSATDATSQAGLYRAIRRLGKHFDITLAEYVNLNQRERDKLAERVVKYMQRRQDELVRDQKSRDRIAAKAATRGKRVPGRRRKGSDSSVQP